MNGGSMQAPDTPTLSPTPRAILESWARLSAAETEAIETANWVHLGTLHRAKAALRQRLDALDDGKHVSDPELATQVAELLERERSNLALVVLRRTAAEAERAVVERARWNLRRQMGSFGHRPATSWQQYS
jgi:hypothetical protein